MFYYYSNHGVPVGRFKNRVQWQGNMSRWDGSIRLQDTSVNDSGIYECELRLLQNSSIFRSQTVLHVSPAVPRGACRAPGLLPLPAGSRSCPHGSPAAGLGSPRCHPLPWCLPGRRRSSRRRGCRAPERLWVLAGRGGLWLRGRGGGVPGRALREEEVPALALGLGG